jgi:hypothetical protein
MTTVAMKYERFHLAGKNEKIPIFERELDEHVTKPLNAWADKINGLKQRLEMREQARQKYGRHRTAGTAPMS